MKWPKNLWYYESDTDEIIVLHLNPDFNKFSTSLHYRNYYCQSFYVSVSKNTLELEDKRAFKTKEEALKFRLKYLDAEIAKLEKMKVINPEVVS